ASLAADRSPLVVGPLWHSPDPIRRVSCLPRGPANFPIGAWKAPCSNLAPCARSAFSPGTRRALPNAGRGARAWQAWRLRGPSLISQAARLPHVSYTHYFGELTAIALIFSAKSISSTF